MRRAAVSGTLSVGAAGRMLLGVDVLEAAELDLGVQLYVAFGF